MAIVDSMPTEHFSSESDSEEVLDYEESQASGPEGVHDTTLQNDAALFETPGVGLYNTCWSSDDAVTNHCSLNVAGQHPQLNVLAICKHPKIHDLVLVATCTIHANGAQQFGVLSMEDALAHGFQKNPLLSQHAKAIQKRLSELTWDQIIFHYDHKVATLAAKRAADSSVAGGVAKSGILNEILNRDEGDSPDGSADGSADELDGSKKRGVATPTTASPDSRDEARLTRRRLSDELEDQSADSGGGAVEPTTSQVKADMQRQIVALKTLCGESNQTITKLEKEVVQLKKNQYATTPGGSMVEEVVEVKRRNPNGPEFPPFPKTWTEKTKSQWFQKCEDSKVQYDVTMYTYPGHLKNPKVWNGIVDIGAGFKSYVMTFENAGFARCKDEKTLRASVVSQRTKADKAEGQLESAKERERGRFACACVLHKNFAYHRQNYASKVKSVIMSRTTVGVKKDFMDMKKDNVELTEKNKLLAAKVMSLQTDDVSKSKFEDVSSPRNYLAPMLFSECDDV